MAAAIVVEGVSKKYRLAGAGEERLPYRTLRDDLVRWASWPVRSLPASCQLRDDLERVGGGSSHGVRPHLLP